MTQTQLRISTLPLTQVRPDAAQPRRLLPEDLAAAFASGTSPFEMLVELRSRAKRDRSIRERLAELEGLADSIAADGLIQPIRVYPSGDEQYQIEEGERRWWAHHILVQRGDERFKNIAAIVVETPQADPNLLRRRVAENVHRSEFTSIELAQAMARRVEEILATEAGVKRRVAEQRVGKENRMSDRRVRQYVALLTLAPDVQELAQRTRLSESALRSLVGIKDASRQLERARQLANPDKKGAQHVRTRIGGVKGRLASSRRNKRAKRVARAAAKSLSRTRSARGTQTGMSGAAAGRRRVVVKGLEQLIEAGQALHGTELTEAEKAYCRERLGNPEVRQTVTLLVSLLNGDGTGAAREQAAPPPDNGAPA